MKDVTPVKHATRKHSEFSASASHRWMACPGSVRLSRTAPPQVESKYAREGTEAHECLEFLVRRYSNLTAAVAQAKKKWPPDMVAHCFTAAHLIYSLRPSPTAKLLIETRVVLRQISHRFWGTLDYTWVDDWGELTVIDFKYGAGVAVLPFEEDGTPNPQLAYYAAGVAHQHDYEFQTVKLAIIQPRVWQEGDSPVAAGTMTIAGIRKFEKRIKDAMAAANKPDAPLRAGDHCRWCPALPTCPETSTKAMAKADIVFDLRNDFDVVAATPEPLALTPKTIPKLLEACDQLEAWIGAVRAQAGRMAEDGAKIPGYKLVAKRGQRVWQEGAENAAKRIFGKRAYETPEPEFLSPAQLEKRLGPAAKLFTEKYTAQVSSGFNLVRDRDPRSEVKHATDFDIDE